MEVCGQYPSGITSNGFLQNVPTHMPYANSAASSCQNNSVCEYQEYAKLQYTQRGFSLNNMQLNAWRQGTYNLDFISAFSSISRTSMLSTVASHIPEIYRYCDLTYSKTSILKFFNCFVGDLLVPHLFCLSLQELLVHLKSPLVIGCRDDICLGGASAVIAKDIVVVKDDSNTIGLSLNTGKCKMSSFKACVCHRARLVELW